MDRATGSRIPFPLRPLKHRARRPKNWANLFALEHQQRLVLQVISGQARLAQW